MPSKTTIDLIRPSSFGRVRVIEPKPAWHEILSLAEVRTVRYLHGGEMSSYNVWWSTFDLWYLSHSIPRPSTLPKN